MLKISIPKLCLEFTHWKLQPHFLGNNELILFMGIIRDSLQLRGRLRSSSSVTTMDSTTMNDDTFRLGWSVQRWISHPATSAGPKTPVWHPTTVHPAADRPQCSSLTGDSKEGPDHQLPHPGIWGAEDQVWRPRATWTQRVDQDIWSPWRNLGNSRWESPGVV